MVVTSRRMARVGHSPPLAALGAHQSVSMSVSMSRSTSHSPHARASLDISDPSANMPMLLRSVESVYFESMTTEDAKNKMHREKVHADELNRRLREDVEKLTLQLAQEKQRAPDGRERGVAAQGGLQLGDLHPQPRRLLGGSLRRAALGEEASVPHQHVAEGVVGQQDAVERALPADCRGVVERGIAAVLDGAEARGNMEIQVGRLVHQHFGGA